MLRNAKKLSVFPTLVIYDLHPVQRFIYSSKKIQPIVSVMQSNDFNIYPDIEDIRAIEVSYIHF